MAEFLIVGGGFGGLAAAHELRESLGEEHSITLVDRQDRFFMGFAKLWDLGGIRPLDGGTRSLASLDARGVRFVRAEVEAIVAEKCQVATSAGDLRADALIVALGAGPSPSHRELLAAPGAHDLYDATSLPAIHAALDEVDGGAVVVSILGAPFKCPPAPYEAALLVDERLRARGVRDRVDVVVTTPQPATLPVAGPDASAYVASHLGERGITLLAERPVAGTDHERHVVRFGDGSEQPFALLLGVPATAPPRVVRDSGLAGASGWIEPDRHSLRTPFERVYAVGDCTMIPTATAQLPKAGVFAAAEGAVAARNALADLGLGEEARFDGHGFCFLELPGRRVAFVEGDFYAEPRPDVHLTEADAAQFARKQAYERERLDLWLG